MITATHKITLDLHKPTWQQITVVDGDTANRLIVQLYNDGVPQLLTEAGLILLVYTNGSTQELAISEDKLTASVMLNPACYKHKSGVTAGQVRVYSGDGGLLTAVTLRINIIRQFLDNGAMPDPSYPALDQYVRDAVDKYISSGDMSGDESTLEDMLQLLIDEDMLLAVTSDGAILTDENKNIILW